MRNARVFMALTSTLVVAAAFAAFRGGETVLATTSAQVVPQSRLECRGEGYSVLSPFWTPGAPTPVDAVEKVLPRAAEVRKNLSQTGGVVNQFVDLLVGGRVGWAVNVEKRSDELWHASSAAYCYSDYGRMGGQAGSN
jgi:hypothetical protein